MRPIYRHGGHLSYFGLNTDDPVATVLICYCGPTPRLEVDLLCWMRRGRELRLAAPGLVLAARRRMLGTRIWSEKQEHIEKRKPMPRRRRPAKAKGRR